MFQLPVRLFQQTFYPKKFEEGGWFCVLEKLVFESIENIRIVLLTATY